MITACFHGRRRLLRVMCSDVIDAAERPRWLVHRVRRGNVSMSDCVRSASA